MTFAGLWEEWRPDPETEPVRTFTIVTTKPIAWMRELHHRMPLILEEKAQDAWLDPEASEGALLEFGQPCRDDISMGTGSALESMSPRRRTGAARAGRSIPRRCKRSLLPRGGRGCAPRY
jgi:putative SOS response-associated peptidase YedK